MGEIVNLRDFRKKRARQDKEGRAAANREKFGRTKGERARDDHDRSTTETDLDGKRLDDDES